MSEENNEKAALVPRLRFPEFRGAREWNKKTLADVCLRITNGKANAEDHEDEGIYPLFDRSEVVKKSSEFAFDDEAVIIPGEGMRFQPKYYKGKFNLHQRAYALMQHQGDARFVYYAMDRFKDTLAKNAVKSTVLSLRLPIIERFCLAVPSKTEQQKIADCLSSLDDLITAEAQKLDALKTHKKGLMQQLFPREGETVPRLRFPEFQNTPEWEATKIGAIGSFYYGKSAPKWSLEENAPTRCVRYGELYTKFGAIITETYSRTNIEAKNLRFSKGGEILVPRVGEKPEDFGKCCSYLPLRNIAIGEMISVFETEQNPLFYTYYFRNLYRQFAKVVEGQNVKNLYFVELEPLPICRPSLAEQQCIAACLSSLDDLIAPQSKKIDALKTHKKGLMQQLFPVLDEAQA